jgi:hypothetical protein
VHVNDRKSVKVKTWFFKNFFAECQQNNSRRRISSPRASWLALGEEFFAENFFLALGEELIHREFLSSPRIFFTLCEEFFAESPRGDSRQRLLLSAKALFPVVLGIQQNVIRECPRYCKSYSKQLKTICLIRVPTTGLPPISSTPSNAHPQRRAHPRCSTAGVR